MEKTIKASSYAEFYLLAIAAANEGYKMRYRYQEGGQFIAVVYKA